MQLLRQFSNYQLIILNFTQVLCFKLFNNARARDIWEVTYQDLESIFEKVITHCQRGLASLLNSLPIYEKVVFLQ